MAHKRNRVQRSFSSAAKGDRCHPIIGENRQWKRAEIVDAGSVYWFFTQTYSALAQLTELNSALTDEWCPPSIECSIVLL